MPEMRSSLEEGLKGRLVRLATALVDQAEAKTLVAPYRKASGFWFGGGGVVQMDDGAYYLVGRYRNEGDSRTGLSAGPRGLELCVMASASFFGAFERVLSLTKDDLSASGVRVLSIEGSALWRVGDGWELFVSSEKEVPYPVSVRDYQKPGTGVWSIDRIAAGDLAKLDPGSMEPALVSDRPEALHVKDPVVFEHPSSGLAMIYCSHPFAWSSSNTGLAVRAAGDRAFVTVTDSMLRRGPVWDVAATRITDRLPVPALGPFGDLPPMSLYFYDGAECLRRHDQHGAAVRRPRGYSCEELGGLAWGYDGDFPTVQRLSLHAPLFVSPWGTGCSRYVSTLVTDDAVYTSWQQSQPDGSQPLVGHWLAMEVVERILEGRE